MREKYQKTILTASLSLDSHPELILRPDFKKNKALASDNSLSIVESPDLQFVKFIMASEHENLNGDYFSRNELIKARHTPQHKPFNIEHVVEETSSYITAQLYNSNKNTIVGHIVGSALARKDGTILTEKEVSELDKTDDPKRPHDESLDLVASAVLYNFLFPATVADIREMSESGDLSVSMETWFIDYDFMIDSEIVKATESNKVSLTKDWESGKIVGGRRVSRALKSILFGGVAGTDTPANIESVFLSAKAQSELEKLKKRHAELHILFESGDSSLKDEYIKEHEDVTRAVASILTEFEQRKQGE